MSMPGFSAEASLAEMRGEAYGPQPLTLPPSRVEAGGRVRPAQFSFCRPRCGECVEDPESRILAPLYQQALRRVAESMPAAAARRMRPVHWHAKLLGWLHPSLFLPFASRGRHVSSFYER